MKKCKSCGHGCARNARTCPSCGHKFTSAVTKFITIILLILLGIWCYSGVVVSKREAQQYNTMPR